MEIIANITLISAITESKNSTTVISWNSYFERQNSDINKVLSLIFSGFNSTNELPSTYKDDPIARSDMQWELKI